MDLLLKGVCWQIENQKYEGDIRIRNGIISEIHHTLQPQKKEQVIQLDKHFIYPGLINSHDHLEMNLYPKLGNPPYGNYIEWGHDVYRPGESPIKEIEKINIKDRLLWGGLKNLISGATTVVHHNPWHRMLASSKFPVRVLKNYTWSHSLAFGKRHTDSFPKKNNIPYIIHVAEGIDELASREIKQLDDHDLLKGNTVLIHAIALSDSDIGRIKAANASIVWCPASNYFLFKTTASFEKLNGKIKLGLGSDSTLTGSATLLAEMQFTWKNKLASAEEIYHLVTTSPAKIFNLPTPQIKINSPADLLLVPRTLENYYDNLASCNCDDVELVMIDGGLRLTSETAARQLGKKKYFTKVGGVTKWFPWDVLELKKRLRKSVGKLPDQNPLWQMID